MIWLNELEPWIGYRDTDLNADTIARFSAWQRPVILLAAYKRDIPKGADRFKDPAADLHRHFPAVELAARLTGADLAAARADPTFSAVADRLRGEGVGEFLIAAEHIRSTLTLTRPEERDAVAVANAVIDWRRCGLKRPTPRDALAELFPVYRSGAASEQRLKRGIESACDALIENVALVTETPDGLVPYDFAVRVREERSERVPHEMWQSVLSTCSGEPELLSVFDAAYLLDERSAAEAACQRADDRGSAEGAWRLGVMLHERGDTAGAEAAYRRADERGSAKGACNLGTVLAERGDLPGAEAAWKRADDRGEGQGAFNLGVLLEERGELERAEASYRRADDCGRADAAYNVGVLLMRRGDLLGAEAAYQRADDRGSAEGAYGLGLLLEERGDLAGAEAAHRRADDRGSADAAFNLGVLLKQRGDLAGAEAAYRRADERGSAEGACNLGTVLAERGGLAGAEAEYSLGALLYYRGDLAGAEAAWKRADDRASANGAYVLAVLLELRGDPAGAEAARRRADDRGSAGEVARNLGALLRERRDWTGAEELRSQVERPPDPT